MKLNCYVSCWRHQPDKDIKIIYVLFWYESYFTVTGCLFTNLLPTKKSSDSNKVRNMLKFVVGKNNKNSNWICFISNILTLSVLSYAGLSAAAIEYSCPSVCLCVYKSVYTITQL